MILHINIVGNKIHVINWLNVCDKIYAIISQVFKILR